MKKITFKNNKDKEFVVSILSTNHFLISCLRGYISNKKIEDRKEIAQMVISHTKLCKDMYKQKVKIYIPFNFNKYLGYDIHKDLYELMDMNMGLRNMFQILHEYINEESKYTKEESEYVKDHYKSELKDIIAHIFKDKELGGIEVKKLNKWFKLLLD